MNKNKDIYIYIYIYILYIYIYVSHEAYVMKICDSDLGRCSPGDGRVLCKGNTYPVRHIWSKWLRNLP